MNFEAKLNLQIVAIQFTRHIFIYHKKYYISNKVIAFKNTPLSLFTYFIAQFKMKHNIANFSKNQFLVFKNTLYSFQYLPRLIQTILICNFD